MLDPTDTVGRLQAAYAVFSDRYFGGRLPGAVIRFEPPDQPGSFGDCAWWSSAPVIRVNPDILTGEHRCVRGGSLNPVGLYRLCADVLLHESVHVYLAYLLNDRGMDRGGHHERFAAECRRIDAQFPDRRKRSHLRAITADNCDFWPENRRKWERYYLGCLRWSWGQTATAQPPAPPPQRFAANDSARRGIARDVILAKARTVKLGL